MPESGSLAEYPGLARWYKEQAAAPPTSTAPAAWLVWRTCEALNAGRTFAVRRFLDGFHQFLAVSANPLADFIAAETLTQRHDAALLDLLGELGETAVQSDNAAGFQAAMQAGADATGLVVLRFLSAWTALNTGNLDDCVAECEKVDEPFGSLYTIHGQALLELGNAAEACEVLGIAVKLAPTEILAWFQLAKAHHVLNRHELACAALRECRRLAPQSDEVALYLGLLALETGDNPDLASEALTALRPALERQAGTPMLVFTVLRLCCLADDKGSMTQIMSDVPWDHVLASSDTLRLMPPLLRELQDARWMDMAAALLQRLVPATDAGA